MKPLNHRLAILAIVLLITFNITSAQKVLLTLPQDERILYAESYLSLFDSNQGLQVCTIDEQGMFYLHKNGKKQGPYEDVEEVMMLIEYPGDEDYYNDQQGDNLINQANNMDYVSMGDDGNIYITAKGIKSGPFSSVKDLYFTAGGNAYMGVVSRPQDDYTLPPAYLLIRSGQSDIELEGEPFDLKVSPGVKSGILATVSEEIPEIDYNLINEQNEKMMEMARKLEEGEVSMEQLQKFVEEREKMEKQMRQSTKDFYVYTTRGEVFGPYKSDVFSGDNPAYGYNSGERWHMLADGRLYLNGMTDLDLGGYSHITGLWWSAKSNTFAYSTYESIVFSSGESYPAPLEIKVVEEGGLTILKWLTLEDEKRFVLYEKSL